MKYILIPSLAAILCGQDINAQSGFQNLNFESATLSPSSGNNFVPISAALPGWTAYLGATQQTEVLQNGSTEGAPSIDIFGPNYSSAGPQGAGFAPGLIDGKYTVLLQSSSPGPGSGNATIEQDGTIPLGIQSLEFKAWAWYPPTAIMAVSFNGNTLAPVAIGNGPNYTLYAANVSSFAGQTGELAFSAVFNFAGPSWIEFDDISLSNVPEPSAMTLISIGGLLFGAREWFARR
jgi:hypothetical protein